MALTAGEELAFCVIFSILIFINIIGNTMGIITIMRSKPLRSTAMYLLLTNLCIADLIVAVFFIPRYVIGDVIVYPDSSTSAEFLCKVITHSSLSWVALQASVFTLVTIAFERYFVIVHPRSEYGRFSKQKLVIVFIVCWIYSFVFAIPDFISLTYDRAKGQCLNSWSSGLKTLAAVFWFINNGPVPLILLGILFGKIHHKISASWRTETAVSRRALLTSRKRISQSALIAVLFYTVSWLPNMVFFLLSNLITVSETSDVLYVASHAMLLLYVTVIPYVFMAQDGQFKASFVLLFTRRNRVVASSAHTVQEDGVLKRVTQATPFVLTPRNDTEVPTGYDIPIWGADMDDESEKSNGKEMVQSGYDIPIWGAHMDDESEKSNGKEIPTLSVHTVHEPKSNGQI